MAEISTIGNYGKSELPSCMDGRSNPLMDRNVAEALNLSLYIFLSPSLFASSYLSIYLSIHLSIWPSTFLSIKLSMYDIIICLSIYKNISINVSTFISIDISLSLSLSVCLADWLTKLSICLCIYASISLPIYDIYASIFLFIWQEAFMRDFPQKWKLRATKRSNSTRHPENRSWHL